MRPLPALPLLLCFLFCSPAAAQEICTNGLDDDADGLVDLNDASECGCQPMLATADSLIPNGSLEEHTCLPSNWSYLFCAVGWYQGTSAEADYYHTDGFFLSPPLPTPLPGNGNACAAGFINRDFGGEGSHLIEYPRVCLPTPLVAGTPYTFHASVAGVLTNPSTNVSYPVDYGPVDLTLFGNTICGVQLPGNGCPTVFEPNWVELGHASYQATGEWGEVSFTFTPAQAVTGLMFGGPCEPPLDFAYPPAFGDTLPYFYYDEFELTGAVPSAISGTGHLCTGDLVLSADPVPVDNALQWYFNGVALVGESGSTLDVSALGTGPGTYQFTGTADLTCSIVNFEVPPPAYPTPTIAMVDDALFCPEPGPYQWFVDGAEIPGATQASFIPTENGSYQVATTNAEGCTGISEPFELLNVGITGAQVPDWIMIAPPGSEVLQIRGASSPFHFELFDAAGRRLATAQGKAVSWDFPVSGLPHGLYLVRVDGRPVRWVH